MKITQEKVVLNHIKTFGSITSWEAFENYGITRLSAVIYSLRKDGNEFEVENVTTKNRFGNPVTYAKYSLKEKDNEI